MLYESTGLTAAEDQELRQLIWFCRVGDLSDSSAARLLELIRRDRRLEVRDPRPDPVSRAQPEPTPSAPKFERNHFDTVTCPNCGSNVQVTRS